MYWTPGLCKPTGCPVSYHTVPTNPSTGVPLPSDLFHFNSTPFRDAACRGPHSERQVFAQVWMSTKVDPGSPGTPSPSEDLNGPQCPEHPDLQWSGPTRDRRVGEMTDLYTKGQMTSPCMSPSPSPRLWHPTSHEIPYKWECTSYSRKWNLGASVKFLLKGSQFYSLQSSTSSVQARGRSHTQKDRSDPRNGTTVEVWPGSRTSVVGVTNSVPTRGFLGHVQVRSLLVGGQIPLGSDRLLLQ